jgi:hypothetical protein
MKSPSKKTPSIKPKNAIAKTEKKSEVGHVTVISKLTASSLKDVLWETLLDLKQDNMQSSRADAIAAQAREILRTVKVQLQVAGQSRRDVPTEIIEFSEKK